MIRGTHHIHRTQIPGKYLVRCSVHKLGRQGRGKQEGGSGATLESVSSSLPTNLWDLLMSSSCNKLLPFSLSLDIRKVFHTYYVHELHSRMKSCTLMISVVGGGRGRGKAVPKKQTK